MKQTLYYILFVLLIFISGWVLADVINLDLISLEGIPPILVLVSVVVTAFLLVILIIKKHRTILKPHRKKIVLFLLLYLLIPYPFLIFHLGSGPLDIKELVLPFSAPFILIETIALSPYILSYSFLEPDWSLGFSDFLTISFFYVVFPFLYPFLLYGFSGWIVSRLENKPEKKSISKLAKGSFVCAVIGLILISGGIWQASSLLGMLGSIFTVLTLFLGITAIVCAVGYKKEPIDKKRIIIPLLISVFTLIIIFTLFPKQRPARNSRIYADMIQLKSTATQIYEENNSNYTKLSCNYNDAMRLICQDLEYQAEMKPIIHSSTTEYCVYIKLYSKNTYVCIDSAGPLRTTTINPSAPGYCTGNTFVCPPGK